MANSGEKWGKVMKSGKSGKKWERVGKSGESEEKWRKGWLSKDTYINKFKNTAITTIGAKLYLKHIMLLETNTKSQEKCINYFFIYIK